METVLRNRVAVSGFMLLLTLVVAGFFGWSINAAAGVVLFLASGVLAVCFARRRAKGLQLAALLVFCAAAGCGMLSIRQYRNEDALRTLGTEPVTITGYVCDLPEYDGRYRYPLRIETVNGQEIREVRVELVSRSALYGELYDRVEGELCFFAAEHPTDGTVAYAYRTPNGEVTFSPSSQRGVKYWLYRAREKLSERLDAMFSGDTLGIVKGILLGDTASMSESLEQALRTCGLSHVVVVSGMHLTVVSGILLYGLQGLTGWRRKPCAVLAAAPILAYMGIVGFTPSVLRAGAAMLIRLTAIVFDEDTDGLHSLGWSIVLVAIYDPTVVSGAGFLLSSFSVLGIDRLAPRLTRGACGLFTRCFHRETPKLLGVLFQTAGVSLGAQIMTLPLSALFFSRISWVTLPANLLIFFAVDLMLVLGVPMMAALLLGLDHAALLIGVCVGWCARYCAAVIRWLGFLPIAAVSVHGTLFVIAGMGCMAAVILCLILRKPRAGALTCAAVVALCALCHTVLDSRSITITVTDSGCFLRDRTGAVSVIGFDDAEYGASDAMQIADTYGVDGFGLVIWDDFSEWSALMKTGRARCVVTDQTEIAASSLSVQLLPSDSDIEWNGVRYRCRDGTVRVETGGVAMDIVQSVEETPCVPPPTPLVIRRTADGDGLPTVEISVKHKNLAADEKCVYNSSSETYTITVFDSGRYWIEKG